MSRLFSILDALLFSISLFRLHELHFQVEVVLDTLHTFLVELWKLLVPSNFMESNVFRKSEQDSKIQLHPSVI